MNAPVRTAADRFRHDGWTPDRQRSFLEAIAEGHTVDSAARLVGMSASSAYSFRRRAPGQPFALGWSAANLLAREKLAATLYARAMDGQVETVTRPDGSTITRLRFDNRLASTMLARLDRQVENPVHEPEIAAARMIAQEFDAFLDVIEQDQGPARAGLFLGTRAATAVDLAPIVTLARADRWCRTGAAAASEVATADLDPAARAGWTAEQWQRAEAAGLLMVGVVPEAVPEEAAEAEAGGPQLCELHDPYGYETPVWWDYEDRAWRTRFPPPPGFWGHECGIVGSDNYSRGLSPDEEAALDAAQREEREANQQAESEERDRYFGFAPGDPARQDLAPASAPSPAMGEGEGEGGQPARPVRVSIEQRCAAEEADVRSGPFGPPGASGILLDPGDDAA